MAKRTYIDADTDIVQSFQPNKDGKNGASKTFTCILKDGTSFSFPCTGPEDFENAELSFKQHPQYLTLKAKIGKEKNEKE